MSSETLGGCLQAAITLERIYHDGSDMDGVDEFC